jgi:hypothetical protein|tara:strand:+ start:402 stop:770 length:369 start_codon:yes stop_codon:yes gene_type:complete
MATKVQRIMTQPIVRAPPVVAVASAPPPESRSRARVAAIARAPADASSHSNHPSSSLARAQNLIFRFLQTKARIQIWLYENTDVVVEGRIIVRPRGARSRAPDGRDAASPAAIARRRATRSV